MKELANNILAQIEVDISEIDLYGYDIIETSLSMVYFQPKRTKFYFSKLRNRKYSVGCYSSIRYTRLKHNVLMVAMK